MIFALLYPITWNLKCFSTPYSQIPSVPVFPLKGETKFHNHIKREDNGFAYFDRVWMGDRENEILRNEMLQTLPKLICS
jgi:hypothetical protein